MTYSQVAGIACVLLFLGMMVSTFAGYLFGRRRLERVGDTASTGTGPVEGAVFALLGLLTAFTFSGAYARLEARRELIVKEANAIGTAYLRLDLLPASAQPAMRERFVKYARSRGTFFILLSKGADALAELAQAATLQEAIWRGAVAASIGEGSHSARILLLPAINDMIDITTTREIAAETHPPLGIYAMLFGLALVCALLTGYGMARAAVPSRIHVIAFAAVTALTIYVTLDIEYPRAGFIRLDETNRILVDLPQRLEQLGAARSAPPP